MADNAQEIEKRSTSVLTRYFYVDSVNKVDRISREVYKKKDLEIHYPRGFDGGEKYKTFKQFRFEGFAGKLPVGVVKSVLYGWGFTKALNPFTFHIEENYKFETVVIKKGGRVDFDTAAKTLYLNEDALALLNKQFTAVYAKSRADIDYVMKSALFSLFPKHVKEPQRTYRPNALALSLASWGNDISEFSDDDKTAINELFDKLSVGTDFLNTDALAKTKEIIDNKYIKATLSDYKAIMKIKNDSDNLEKQWQTFLKTNSWIFSYVFAQPIILHQKEAYAGGKGIDNTNGKFSDFVIKNSLSENVSFLEIKTHKTKLVERTPYRGEDVFCVGKEVTGCIAQVLNQRDMFQKSFYQKKYDSRDKGDFETYNSKCVILLGSLRELTKDQRYSFELFRSNSRDVEVITFDELLVKIEALQKVVNIKK